MKYRFSYRIVFTCILAFMVAFPVCAESMPAEVVRGLNWLKATIQADGSIQGEGASIARPVQVRHQVLATMEALGEPVSAQLATRLSEDGGEDAEALALRIVGLRSLGSDPGELISRLLAYRNADGGFGPFAGFQSTPLDTAYALLALEPAGGRDSEIAAAVAWLSARVGQLTALDTPLEPAVYTASRVMQLLERHAVRHGLGAALGQLSEFLLARRTAVGAWGDASYLSALAYLATRNFTTPEPLASELRAHLALTQRTDGSWEGDPYITALALVAWQASTELPSNPLLAGIRGRLLDAQTHLAIPGANIELAGVTSVNSAADGGFAFNNLSPGDYSLRIQRQGYAVVTATASLAAGQILDFGELRLIRQSYANTGIVSGVVRESAGGQGLQGALVTVAGGPSALTGTDGSYQILDIPTGQISIVAKHQGYRDAEVTATLSAGGVLLFSPFLTPDESPTPPDAPGDIVGHVLDAGADTPLTHVTITATHGGATHTTTSDAQGRFEFNGLDAALAELGFVAPGYVGVTLPVALSPGETLDIGQVRLRKEKAEVLLPDLTIHSASRTSVVTDPQTLELSGNVTVTVANIGSMASQVETEVLAFHDQNRNGAYDEGADVMLGRMTLPALSPEEEQATSIPVSGVSPFRDAPIQILVDSGNRVVEAKEDNNLADTSDACQVKPDPGGFAPKLKWAWTGSSTLSGFRQVMSMPVVAPLEDTNRDGKVDGRDIPAVIFNTFYDYYYQSNGVLRAISGVDGRELWTQASFRVMPESTPAVADIDGDGHVEIVVPRSGGGSLAIDHRGAVKWQSAYPGNAILGAASIADIDADGQPEIIFGNTVMNADGSLRWQGSGNNGSYFASGVVDLDLDGIPEIVVGASAYSNTGRLLWQDATINSRFVAIGDFDADPNPEIVVVAGGAVYLLNHDGARVWGPVYIPGGGGGAPTIADMDGDGRPDIGVAGASRYAVFRADGSLLWSSVTADYSSAQTGSSVFDFDGDGQAEVVYADERTLWVYEGRTGKVLFSKPNSSGTLFELPVIADVDADGHADIVLCTNDYAWGSNGSGIRVYSDANNTWVPTRRIWNQHGYHITNINDDGSVPRVAQNSWQVHNTYRLNAQPGLSPTATADLTSSWLRIQDAHSPALALATVRIGNGGARAAPAGVPVTFYSGEPGHGGVALGVVHTPRELAGGEHLDLELALPGGLSGIQTLWVVADDNGVGTGKATECDESNNRLSLAVSAGNVIPSLTYALSTDRTAYPANSPVAIQSAMTNAGGLTTLAKVALIIETGEPAQMVASLPQAESGNLLPGAQTVLGETWNTARFHAGGYRVKADFLDASGRLLHTQHSAFDILPTCADAADCSAQELRGLVRTDKARYSPRETVSITGRVRNATLNEGWAGLSAEMTVTSPAGQVFWSRTAQLNALAPETALDLAHALELGAAPAGEYHATLMVRDAQGQVRVQAASSFSVASTADTGAGLGGSLVISPNPAPVGDTVSLDYQIHNHGNADLAVLSLTLSLTDPAQQSLLASWLYDMDLPMGASRHGSTGWTVTGSAGITYVASLAAEVAGKTHQLAQANLTLGPPAIRLELEAGIDARPRVLTLAACPAPLPAGQTAAICAAQRTQWLDAYLGARTAERLSLGSASDHLRTLRCGRYNVHWLSGSGHLLDPRAAAELVAARRRGAGMLNDGGNGQRNSALDLQAGALYQALMPASDYTVSLLDPLFEPLDLPTPGKALRFNPAGAEVQGVFGLGATDQPALFHRPRAAAGPTLLAAFDLAAALQTGLWDFPFQTMLNALAPTPPEVIAAGTWAPVRLSIANRGADSLVTVSATLPAGVRLDGLPQGAALDNAGNPVWRFDLASGAHHTLPLALWAPASSGLFNVPFVVTAEREGVTYPQGTAQAQFHVVSADSAGHASLDAIRMLPVTDEEQPARDATATALDQALNDLAQNRPVNALETLLQADAQLARITSVTVEALRDALAYLIAEAEARVCKIPPLVCDVDLDGDIDQYDTAVISRARGKAALLGDLRDANGDRWITPSDVMVCIPRCTRPNCAP